MNCEQSLDRSNAIKDEEIEKTKKAIMKGVRECQKILVFGHPGVGKTYLIKNMVEQYSQDVTKRWIYYHLSELVISSNNQIYEQFESLLLQQQNESQQYIVVFDEIDVLYDPTLQFTRMKEIMIRLLSQSKIGIIALTNRPNRIPSQVLQRLTLRIMIDLPNNDLRSQIIIRQLSNIPNELDEEDIKQLSLLTQLYTFSDLMLVMRQLSYKPLRKLLYVKSFNRRQDNLYHPCQEQQAEKGVTLLTRDPKQFFFERIRRQQIKQVLVNIQSSVNNEQNLQMLSYLQGK